MKVHVIGNWETRQVWLNGSELSPIASQKVFNHSPDGFNWGYGGSGPAQLALAILLKYTDKETALKEYQNLKWREIAKWPQSDIDLEIEI
jgi:hypothetical protein